MAGQKHLYHLVDPSPWPLVTAFSVFGMLVGGVMYMHSIVNGLFVLFIGLVVTVFCCILWWRDVIREATYEGHHTSVVQKGLRYGMVFFIVSEVMFFVAFFWAFFHSSLVPTIEIGAIWPPAGVEPFNPWAVPFLNTLILLTSGATATWAHHAVLAGKREQALLGLESTLGLAIAFTGLQAFEYAEASFSIADGIYGSTFYLATGFHGFHVIVGTLMLTVCAFRLYYHQFTREHHFGLEASLWYWHFVDVVWLFLFTVVYWWGSY
jgi:heme/copper-type cytochrome/quinol oxidase subunit 3